MSIYNLEQSKKLRAQGERLGREGISQRINQLVLEFAKNNPEGHYREAIMLAGRLHALYLATHPQDYWREVAHRGFTAELYEITKFERITNDDANF
ncbi:MAG TPA: hypothetical protein VLE21_05170 [Candidatus Nitrosocosmicus sp.]|nr:hypothetical protein [Candidatus Nitrosocosmicus sp.]